MSFKLLLIFIFLNAIIEFTFAKNQDPKCLLPMEPGPCRMNLERYYYNSKTNTCEIFKFGGCRGNDNKFGFKQTCEEACLLVTTPTTTKPTTTTRATTTRATVNNNARKPVRV